MGAIKTAEETAAAGIEEAKTELNDQFEKANAEIQGKIVDTEKAVEGHKERINRVRTRAKVLTDRVKGDCNDRNMDARVAHMENEAASTEEDKDAIEKSYAGLQEVRARRRLASMTPSEQVLARRRLTNRPKSHIVVLEALLEEIN